MKITVREGKVFDAQDKRIRAVCALPEVEVFTETLEENAMVQYKDRQAMVVLKGVEDNFEELTAIDSILYGAGEFVLHDSIVNYGVMGVELVATLGTGLEFVDPLQVYLPKRNAKVNMANPGASFNRDYLYSPGVVFVVNQQEYDGKYILTSLDFLRQLLDYTTEVSAMELKLKPNVNTSSVQGFSAVHCRLPSAAFQVFLQSAYNRTLQIQFQHLVLKFAEPFFDPLMHADYVFPADHDLLRCLLVHQAQLLLGNRFT